MKTIRVFKCTEAQSHLNAKGGMKSLQATQYCLSDTRNKKELCQTKGPERQIVTISDE